MRLSVRTLEGILIKEVIEDIFEPKVYSYSMLDLLAPEIVLKELSIYVEFTSNENLAVPFCAVIGVIESPETIDHIHSYGRAIEVSEINSQIDFKTSFETGNSRRNTKRQARVSISKKALSYSCLG